MSVELFRTITLLSSCIVIVPLSIALFRFRALNFEQRYLTILLGVTAAVEAGANYFWYNGWNNLLIYHFYTVVQFILITLLYTRKLEGLFPSVLFRILISAFILFAITNAVFFQSVRSLNTNVIILGSFIYILFSISYFYKLLKEVNYESLQNNPMFWINAGILIYFSSTLILFVLGNRLIPESLRVIGVAWSLHALFNIFLNMFYALALWVKPQT